LAAQLIERKVAVLFAGASDVAAGALRVAAATVPVVVATGSDPVAAGPSAPLGREGIVSECFVEWNGKPVKSVKTVQ
jgi:ABC-type uncharacterized transport system substrate-binding protein